MLASLRLYPNRLGIIGRFSLRETLSINERAVTVETLTMGKRRRALAPKFLLRLPVMSCFIIHPVGNRGAFSLTEKAPD